MTHTPFGAELMGIGQSCGQNGPRSSIRERVNRKLVREKVTHCFSRLLWLLFRPCSLLSISLQSAAMMDPGYIKVQSPGRQLVSASKSARNPSGAEQLMVLWPRNAARRMMNFAVDWPRPLHITEHILHQTGWLKVKAVTSERKSLLGRRSEAGPGLQISPTLLLQLSYHTPQRELL